MLKIKKIKVALILVLSSCFVLLSQNDSTYYQSPRQSQNKTKQSDFNWKEKLIFGGNFWFQFGRVSYIDISPLIGYKVTKDFIVSAGPVYSSISQSYGNTVYRFDLYGGRILARYYILQSFYAQVGWDKLNRPMPYQYATNNRVWIDNVWVGGGLKYPIGGNSYSSITILYNLNQTDLSPYTNPYIQVGFMFGF